MSNFTRNPHVKRLVACLFGGFVGALMIWGASVIVWLLLNVKHTELAEDAPEGVHVG